MFRPTRRAFVDYLVYLFVRALVCVIQCVSIETAHAACRFLAMVAYQLDRRHREIAIENLRIAFGEQYSELERKRIVQGVYAHFCMVLVEMAFIPRKLHVTNWKRFATLDAAPAAIDLLVQDRGKVFVTGHLGNWEMAGYLLAVTGLQPTTIARDLDNRYLHDFVLRFRSWSGQKMVSKNGDFESIERTLRERRTLVSVGDQSAGPRGAFVEFFGRLASTHKAIALLSIEHDAPVMVGYSHRDRSGFHYRTVCLPPIDPAGYRERPSGVMELTQAFTRQLEAAVRTAPEQYFWLHNRWKHQPAKRQRKAA